MVNLRIFRPPFPFAMVFNDHFHHPLPLPKKFEIAPLPWKTYHSSKDKKVGEKITHLFTNDNYLL